MPLPRKGESSISSGSSPKRRPHHSPSLAQQQRLTSVTSDNTSPPSVLGTPTHRSNASTSSPTAAAAAAAATTRKGSTSHHHQQQQPDSSTSLKRKNTIVGNNSIASFYAPFVIEEEREKTPKYERRDLVPLDRRVYTLAKLQRQKEGLRKAMKAKDLMAKSNAVKGIVTINPQVAALEQQARNGKGGNSPSSGAATIVSTESPLRDILWKMGIPVSESSRGMSRNGGVAQNDGVYGYGYAKKSTYAPPPAVSMMKRQQTHNLKRTNTTMPGIAHTNGGGGGGEDGGGNKNKDGDSEGNVDEDNDNGDDDDDPNEHRYVMVKEIGKHGMTNWVKHKLTPKDTETLMRKRENKRLQQRCTFGLPRVLGMMSTPVPMSTHSGFEYQSSSSSSWPTSRRRRASSTTPLELRHGDDHGDDGTSNAAGNPQHPNKKNNTHHFHLPPISRKIIQEKYSPPRKRVGALDLLDDPYKLRRRGGEGDDSAALSHHGDGDEKEIEDAELVAELIGLGNAQMGFLLEHEDDDDDDDDDFILNKHKKRKKDRNSPVSDDGVPTAPQSPTGGGSRMDGARDGGGAQQQQHHKDDDDDDDEDDHNHHHRHRKAAGLCPHGCKLCMTVSGRIKAFEHNAKKMQLRSNSQNNNNGNGSSPPMGNRGAGGGGRHY